MPIPNLIELILEWIWAWIINSFLREHLPVLAFLCAWSSLTGDREPLFLKSLLMGRSHLPSHLLFLFSIHENLFSLMACLLLLLQIYELYQTQPDHRWYKAHFNQSLAVFLESELAWPQLHKLVMSMPRLYKTSGAWGTNLFIFAQQDIDCFHNIAFRWENICLLVTDNFRFQGPVICPTWVIPGCLDLSFSSR